MLSFHQNSLQEERKALIREIIKNSKSKDTISSKDTWVNKGSIWWQYLWYLCEFFLHYGDTQLHGVDHVKCKL